MAMVRAATTTEHVVSRETPAHRRVLRSVDLMLDLRARHESAHTPIVISGCVGPRAGSTRHELTLIARAATRSERQAAARPRPNAAEDMMRSRLMYGLGHHACVLDE